MKSTLKEEGSQTRGNSSSVLDKVYKRDNGICWRCNIFVPREQATKDHIVPKSWGGPNNIDNYALAHKVCNEKRGNTWEWKVAPDGSIIEGFVKRADR